VPLKFLDYVTLIAIVIIIIIIIIIDSHLTFNLHISNILTKATQRAGVFFCGFASRHPALVRKVTYIRPTLEFNSNIWNPTKKHLLDKLENI